MKTDLVEIFQTIRAEMQPYATMGFDARTNSDTAYELWKERKVIDGVEKKELHFASASIKKNYVHFEFMPSEIDADIKAIFHPSLLSLLKEKSIFHIDKLDEALLKQITEALAAGFKLFKQNEWV